MPTYMYCCDTNGQEVRVRHGMNEKLTTWGELCERAEFDPGETPVDAPIRKLLSAPAIISSSSRSNPEPPCATGGGCPGGACGFPG